ncbi:hypothetical protein EUX57_27620 [Pseudomonas orientalis]|uniref:Uncharacterized protein n=1 Tax=Pseudomonas orientalis TaxID=76758 RepID=A0A4V2DWX2_9PSED|nr:hypothetical protein EUX57_27620 [Pseudomonas orientalis]
MHRRSPVGGGLPPIAVYQPRIDRLTLCYRGIGIRNHDAKRVARDLDLLVISGAPLNHAGRTQA